MLLLTTIVMQHFTEFYEISILLSASSAAGTALHFGQSYAVAKRSQDNCWKAAQPTAPGHIEMP